MNALTSSGNGLKWADNVSRIALMISTDSHTGPLSRTLELKTLVLAIGTIYSMGPALVGGTYKKVSHSILPEAF